MISPAVFAACILTFFVSLILPLGLLVFLGIRYRRQGMVSAWLLGAAGFFVSQMVLRIPLLNLLSQDLDFVMFAQDHVAPYALALAFSAGLFELGGRLAAAWAMGKNLTYPRALAAGLGHGGIEAILLVGLTYVSNLVLLVLVQSGAYDTLIAQTQAAGSDVTALVSAKELLLSTGAGLFLLAGLERLLTMICHTAMSVLVCWGWKNHRLALGCGVCLALHFVLDSLAVVTVFLPQPLSYWLLYGCMGATALLSLFLLRKLRRCWPAA